MKKKRRKINSKLLLILLILGISVGFALLTAVLNINGIGRINRATWNIHWENVEVKEGSVTATTPAEIVDADRTIVEYSIVLEKPGDFYEFTVDAKNDGDIDGMITNISNELLDDNEDAISPLPSFLIYTVTYSDGKEIEENHLLKANRSEKYKVVVKFNPSITEDELPGEDQTLNFRFSVTYQQSDTNGRIRDAICDASIYDDGDLTESRYLDKCEDYIDDSIYTYTEDDDHNLTITGFKDGYSVAQVKNAVRDLKASKLNNTEELKIRKVDNKVISFKDGIWAIPSRINDKKVTSISGDAFNKKGINAVLVLPPTIKTIENGLYTYDSEISEYITYGAFANNNITGVALNPTITKTGDYSFYKTKLTSLRVPGSVKAIDPASFSDISTLRSLVLEKGVEEVGSGTFNNCTALENVDFPNTLTTVSAGGFNNAGIKKLDLPDSLVNLNGGSFYTKSLEEIYTGNGLTRIGGGYFDLTNVKKMVVGDSVTEINSAGSAPKLENLSLGKSVQTISSGSFSGCKLKTLILPDSVQTVSYGAFSGCNDIEYLNTGNGLRDIENGTFYLPNVKKFVVGNSVTRIGSVGCTPYLEDLQLGNSVELITDGAFCNLPMYTIDFPESMKVITNGTFAGSKLNRLTLPDSMERVDNGAFMNSQIWYLDTGNGLTEVSSSALGGNPFEYVIFGDSIENINSSPFNGCSALTTVKFGKNVKYIGDGAFSGTNLSEVDLSNTKVETLGNGLFSNSNVSTVKLRNGITSIANSTFENNNITSITIPSSVTSIGGSAFKDNNISTLKLGGGVTSIGASAFANNNISGSFEFPSSVKRIGDEAFANNSITSISLPDDLEYLSGFNDNNIQYLNLPYNLTEIGKLAFFRNNISSVRIPSSVEKIGQEAFSSCKLTSLYFDNYGELTDIGPSAFTYNQLTRISIPSSVQNIGTGAFTSNRVTGDSAFIYKRENGVVDNTVLDSYAGYGGNVTLPSTVTKIGKSAFYATFITGISNWDQVTEIGEAAFGNTSLSSVNIPSGVTELPAHVFFASRATSVNLNNVQSIGYCAFYSCNLSSVTIPSSVTYIEQAAFFKSSSSNSNLTTITNNTGRSFDWINIVNAGHGDPFETGTVTNDAGDVTITN